MNSGIAVVALGALAHESRLAVFRLLVEAGPEGMTAGDIAHALAIVPSSLTFHTKALQQAGLANRRRVSRQIFYAADFSAMKELIEYLTRNCCGGAFDCEPATARLRA
ncbi:MAG: helix-turn-helix domain-containing protein [Steroidobacteraceae bacterium]